MLRNDVSDEKLSYWRSTFRGYIWLSAPLPFLFICAGYLTSDLKTICRLVTAGLRILYLFIMYRRYDEIVQAMKKQGLAPALSTGKKVLICLGLLAVACVLYGIVLIPTIPLFLRGMMSTGYYLILTICWYQTIKEPKKE